MAEDFEAFFAKHGVALPPAPADTSSSSIVASSDSNMTDFPASNQPSIILSEPTSRAQSASPGPSTSSFDGSSSSSIIILGAPSSSASSSSSSSGSPPPPEQDAEPEVVVSLNVDAEASEIFPVVLSIAVQLKAKQGMRIPPSSFCLVVVACTSLVQFFFSIFPTTFQP